MAGSGSVRPPAVAGTFYPSDPQRLAQLVDSLVADASARLASSGPTPKALIVPHAGYDYSGPVAASAYARLLPARGQVQRVILLGPAHYAPVVGLAATSAKSFLTPLGEVQLDEDGRNQVLAYPHVHIDDRAHAPEHCLEVQLPFLQRLLGEVRVLPLLVGVAGSDEVSSVVEVVWDGPETAILISSDLSHYHDYSSACALDRHTADAIVAARTDQVGIKDACGAPAIRGVLVAAQHHHLSVSLLDLRNSGDTGGPRNRVVGYGAFALA